MCLPLTASFFPLRPGCFTGKQCSEHIAADCGLYTPCKVLLDNLASGSPTDSVDNNINSDESNPLGSTPSETINEARLEELCSPSELGKNWNVCISYCEPYECCFNGRSCDKSKNQCGDYSICAQFFAQSVNQIDDDASSLGTPTLSTIVSTSPEDGTSYIQYTAVELAQACNSKQLSKDPSDCKLLCKGSACCFSSYPSSNCFERQKPYCHDHAICESVFDR